MSNQEWQESFDFFKRKRKKFLGIIAKFYSVNNDAELKPIIRERKVKYPYNKPFYNFILKLL
jgi:hypothetical protein